jgi:hypothetical protein
MHIDMFYSALLALLPLALAAPTSLIIRQGFGSATGNAANFFSPDFSAGSKGDSPSTYVCFRGNADQFPHFSTWMNFNDAFNRQQQANLGPVGDSGPEQGAIYNAIVEVSKAAQVDARVILAIIIQEVCPCPYARSVLSY